MKLQKTVIPALLLFIAWSNAGAQGSVRQERFAAGDAARIQIWQLYESTNGKSPVSNLSGEYVIDTRGNIFMPFVGLIRIANKTSDEVADLIKSKYETFLTDPFIHVRPLIRVTLRGQVTRPGSYRIDPVSSMWDLLDNAGGPTSTADLSKMFVVRGGQKKVGQLLQAFEKAHSLRDVGIQSGDQIVVPETKHFDIRNMINYLSFAASAALLYIRLTENK